MTELYDKWKKSLSKGLSNVGDVEKFKPAIAIKRCPQCHELSLEFDLRQGRIYCTRCGFEEHIQQMR